MLENTESLLVPKKFPTRHKLCQNSPCRHGIYNCPVIKQYQGLWNLVPENMALSTQCMVEYWAYKIEGNEFLANKSQRYINKRIAYMQGRRDYASKRRKSERGKKYQQDYYETNKEKQIGQETAKAQIGRDILASMDPKIVKIIINDTSVRTKFIALLSGAVAYMPQDDFFAAIGIRTKTKLK